MGCLVFKWQQRFIRNIWMWCWCKFKNVLLNSKAEDIKLMKSPVGLPAVVLWQIYNFQWKIKLHQKFNVYQTVLHLVIEDIKIVGYCIADRLGAAYQRWCRYWFIFQVQMDIELKKLSL